MLTCNLSRDGVRGVLHFKTGAGCCGATGFCGSSGLYCDADKGNQIGSSLQLINPYECPDSPPPAPPPGAPPPKVVKECCEEIPGVRPAKCCVYPAGEPQPIPCCADRCGAENVCPSLLPPSQSCVCSPRSGIPLTPSEARKSLDRSTHARSPAATGSDRVPRLDTSVTERSKRSGTRPSVCET